jgi:hypothetical protein
VDADEGIGIRKRLGNQANLALCLGKHNQPHPFHFMKCENPIKKRFIDKLPNRAIVNHTID